MNATDPHATGPTHQGDSAAGDAVCRRPLTVAPLATAAVAAALAALAVLAGCATAAPAAAPGPVKIAVPPKVPAKELAGLTLNVGDQKAGMQAVLTAAGELTDVPYKIKWAIFTSGSPELEALNAGAIDFAETGNTPPVFSAAAGGKIVIVGAGRDTATGDAILVPKGSDIRSVADLKGKRLAVAKGSSGHGNLLLQLKKAGLRPTDLEIIFLTPSDGYAALASDRVAAWVVWDPFTAQAEQQLGARVLANGQGVANGLSFQMASRPALADARRNSAIADLMARNVRAHIWSKAHPQEWARAYSRESGLPYQVALASARRSDDETVTLSPQIVTSEQNLADVLADAKVIPRRPVIADIIDDRYSRIVTDAGARP